MLATNRILSLDSLPWIFLELLDAKAHLALSAVESQDNCLYLVTYLHEVLSRTQVLAPRHLRYVDQALYTWSNLNECTIVSHNHYLTLHVITYLEVLVEGIPWMWSELLQTESDTLLLLIEVEDNNVDLLVERYNLVWIAYAAPREVCDVDQTVNTAEVNEYTVSSDVLNGTLEDLTLLELADDLLTLLLELLLDESLVRYNDIAELLVDLYNLELHCLAYEYVVVAYRVNVDLASWQESFDTENVNDHTALSAALDVTLDNFLVLESCIHTLPRLAEASLLVREYQLALYVLLVLYINFNLVAYLEVWVVTEFRSWDNTIALVTDVYDNLFLVYRDYCSLYNLVFCYLVKSFVIGLLEVCFADVCACAILKLIPIEVVQWLYVL